MDLNRGTGRTKHDDLANFAPPDLRALDGALLESLTRTRGQRALLASFLAAAGLTL